MQIRLTAVELIQGLSGSPEGIARLSTRSVKLLPALFRLVGDEQATSKAALVSLVNMSQVSCSKPPCAPAVLATAPHRCGSGLDRGSAGVQCHLEGLTRLWIGARALQPAVLVGAATTRNG